MVSTISRFHQRNDFVHVRLEEKKSKAGDWSLAVNCHKFSVKAACVHPDVACSVGAMAALTAVHNTSIYIYIYIAGTVQKKRSAQYSVNGCIQESDSINKISP